MNLTITKEAAIAAHNAADKKGKELLEILLGKDNLKPVNIMERVKTFEDACQILGINPEETVITNIPESLTKYKKQQQAQIKLMIVAEAINEGWQPDWNNSNQYKYYPWFDMRSSAGFGFSYTDCDYAYSFTGVGSRLCFKTRELAEYAGKQFESIYKDLLTA